MNVLMMGPGKCIHSQRPLGWLLRAGCRVTFVDQHDPKPLVHGSYRYMPYPRQDWRSYRWLGWRLGTQLAQYATAARLRWMRFRTRADVTHVHWVDERAY